MNPVTIYVERNGNDFSANDKEDQCMKTAVASYQISTGIEDSDGYLGGNMVVLHLREFTYPVKYVDNKGSEVSPCHTDKEIDVTAMATESVLKKLKAANCVDKDLITFQARRGMHPNVDVTGIMSITVGDGPYFMNFRGIVTHTYAYLSERKICLFLDQNITRDTVKKIDEALSRLFPKKGA